MADLSAMILLVSVGALLLAVIQFIPSLQSHIWNSGVVGAPLFTKYGSQCYLALHMLLGHP